MSERIFTLFGEEIVPEPAKPAGKGRAKKEPKEKKPEEEQNKEVDAPPVTPELIPEQETPEPKEQNKETEIPPVTQELIPEQKTLEPKEQNKETEIPPVTPELIAEHETPVPEKKKEEKPEKTSGKKIPQAKVRKIPVPVTADEADEEVNEPAPKRKADYVNLPEDWEGDKQYYAIGEVATLFNVKTSHIRFWTNEFKIKVRTNRKGDRLYTPEQIKEIRAIHHLVKERGFTLSGAKAKMKTQNKRDVETIDLKQSLTQLRGKLLIIRNQLK